MARAIKGLEGLEGQGQGQGQGQGHGHGQGPDQGQGLGQGQGQDQGQDQGQGWGASYGYLLLAASSLRERHAGRQCHTGGREVLRDEQPPLPPRLHATDACGREGAQ